MRHGTMKIAIFVTCRTDADAIKILFNLTLQVTSGSSIVLNVQIAL